MLFYSRYVAYPQKLPPWLFWPICRIFPLGFWFGLLFGDWIFNDGEMLHTPKSIVILYIFYILAYILAIRIGYSGGLRVISTAASKEEKFVLIQQEILRWTLEEDLLKNVDVSVNARCAEKRKKGRFVYVGGILKYIKDGKIEEAPLKSNPQSYYAHKYNLAIRERDQSQSGRIIDTDRTSDSDTPLISSQFALYLADPRRAYLFNFSRLESALNILFTWLYFFNCATTASPKFWEQGWLRLVLTLCNLLMAGMSVWDGGRFHGWCYKMGGFARQIRRECLEVDQEMYFGVEDGKERLEWWIRGILIVGLMEEESRDMGKIEKEVERLSLLI